MSCPCKRHLLICLQAAKDSSGQLQAIQKQLQQFQQETRKEQRHIYKKIEETMQLVEETKKKVDNIMEFLMRSTAVPTEQQPPTMKVNMKIS